jgi:hypothetical protein
MRKFIVYICAVSLFLGISFAIGQEKSTDKRKLQDKDTEKTLKEAIEKGLDYLVKGQAKDGSWGDTFTIAITSIACLAILAHDEKPFDSKYTDAMLKGYEFLIKNCKDGSFPKQGHTWTHGHGFATLFISELYGKILLAEKKPKIDEAKLKETVEKAVKLVEKAQSSTGGWFYEDRAGSDEHENSTTVCAVQALRSAANYGIKIDEKVLEKGFEYLKKCQNKDGGFRYKLRERASMKAGSAGALSTLVLMKKLDHDVLMNGLDYMIRIKQKGITDSGFPYYGHFYGVMAMKIISEEYGKHKPEAGEWFSVVRDEYIKAQEKDGSWPLQGWTVNGGEHKKDYSTAFTLLTLQVPKGNISIFHRDPPKLPKKEEKK